MRKMSKKMAAQRRRLMQAFPEYNIQPGCLVYDVTDSTPIGSKAIRAPQEGARVLDNEILTPAWHGCNRIGFWQDKRIAFTTEFTREHYNDK